jgi:hypothetical protein
LVVAFVASAIVAGLNKKNGSGAAVPQILDVGAHVYHPRFGHGKITGLEGDGYETKVIISFGAKPEEFHLGAAINSGLRVTTN